MDPSYVHGYSNREARRLQDQATTLAELLHADSVWPAGDRVLEAGCGVGSQTTIIARANPDVSFTAIDIADDSLRQAARDAADSGLENVCFMNADVRALPFEENAFDHVFACYLLEHLEEPEQVLRDLARVLKPGGSITVIEGDHGSVYFHPDSKEAYLAIRCQIALQAEAGGNALIGRELYPLLLRAGYRDVSVSPRMVYVDGSKPALIDGFTKNTFTAMIEGVREAALERKLIDAATFDKGIRDLYRTAEPGGTFCYTFFKATAFKGLKGGLQPLRARR